MKKRLEDLTYEDRYQLGLSMGNAMADFITLELAAGRTQQEMEHKLLEMFRMKLKQGQDRDANGSLDV